MLCGRDRLHLAQGRLALHPHQRIRRAADPASIRDDIVIIEVNDTSIRDLAPFIGRWPWPRAVFGALIDYLNRAPARVIAFDFGFWEPDRTRSIAIGDRVLSGEESDAELAAAVARAPGTVLLRQELAGCCATDAHAYLGQWRSEFPVIFGHENVGIVEAIGAGGALDLLGRELKVGDRVVARAGSCGGCYECRIARLPRRCRNITVRYGFTSPERSPFAGGYAEYHYLGSPRTTFMLKVGVPASGTLIGGDHMGRYAFGEGVGQCGQWDQRAQIVCDPGRKLTISHDGLAAELALGTDGG